MKKSRILVLVSVLLVAVMALTACGGSVAFKKYLNPDYDTSAHVYTSADSISGLKDFDFVDSNYFIAVFGEVDEEDGVTYKLVSLNDGSVIATLDKDDTAYEFEFFGPALVVTSTTIDPDDEEAEPEVEYALYDVTGTKLATSDTESEVELLNDNEDFMMYDRVVYEANSKGALTKLADVPEYVSVHLDEYTDSYFYAFDEDENTILVYDREFNYVSFFELPAYADTEWSEFFILNNGDYIVQYRYALDSDATKYDIYETHEGLTDKYEIVTLLVSAKNGSTKDLDLDEYVIQYVDTYNDLYDAEDDNNEYIEDSFDNIVYLTPIEDGKVDYSTSSFEMRFMSNKAKLGGSLKLFDDMVAYDTPHKVSDDVYYVWTVSGMALVDEDGDIIKRISNFSSITTVGEYFVGEDAIYSADLSEVVYDIKEEEAEFVQTLGSSVLFKVEDDEGEYKMVLFHGGETKTVYNSEKADEYSFEVVNEINGYYIYDIMEAEYTYYNANGEKLFTSYVAAQFLAAGDDTFIVYAVDDDEEGIFFFVK